MGQDGKGHLSYGLAAWTGMGTTRRPPAKLGIREVFEAEAGTAAQRQPLMKPLVDYVRSGSSDASTWDMTEDVRQPPLSTQQKLPLRSPLFDEM